MAVIDVASHGATGTGSDDTTAIEAACAAASPGDELFFGPGLFGVTRTIFPPCPVIGTGRLTSRILSLPGMTGPALDIADRSGISISDIGFKGNNTWQSIGAIKFGGYTTPVHNTRIERCGFEDIKADYWVAGGAHFSTFDTFIAENKVATKVTDVRPNGANHVFALYGTTTGAFINSKIHRNSIDGTGVSVGIAIFGQNRKFDISHNDISDMGRSTYWANQYGAVNSYPILMYGLGSSYEDALPNMPSYGSLIGNLIFNPTSAGIYGATASNLLISANSIRGQNATDTILPRGGIALNGCPDSSVLANLLEDCMIGINLDGYPTGNAFVSGNHVKGSGVIGIRTASAVGAGYRVSVMGNDVDLSSASSQAFVNLVTGAGSLVIRNNGSSAAAHGLTAVSSSNREISGNVFF